ncbi:MAG: hypothetical protein HYS05_13555 [Acidobacteria bacterium]|nr:hypothetical protein [Acidobacteriota bacterium]
MRAIALISMLSAALTSTGCLVAGLRPLYASDQLAQDDRLTGTWEGPEHRATLTIERGEWKAYRVTYRGPELGEETISAVYLTTIGVAAFADVTPAGALQKSELVAPLHAIYRVQISDTTLSVRGLDFDWFSRAAKQGALAKLPYAIDDRQHVILTGAPETTRRWLAAHLADDGIYTAQVMFSKR